MLTCFSAGGCFFASGKKKPNTNIENRQYRSRRSAIGGIRPSLDGINHEKGMTVSGDQQTWGTGFRRSADQGTNIRLRLRCSFRLLSFGYVLNDDLRLTQPIRAAHPLHEILLYICREPSTNQPFYAKQTQFAECQNECKLINNNVL